MSNSLDLAALGERYAAGLDPRALVASCLERLAQIDDPGIFITLSDRARLDRAVAALGPYDPVAKPLWGVPFAVKDNIDLAGLPTTAACPDFATTPPRSATVVDRLVAAGAIPLGKTNLDQFATGLVGVRTPYPVPRNSFDPAMVPGGSSSGSAVAVAQGIVSFALGTDTAGSGRVPAGLNNLVGLKPSLGAIPVRGVLPACQTLDCVSIFALTVPDAWDVFRAAAGFDPGDPWSRPIAIGEVPARPELLRIGVPELRSRVFLGDAQSEAAYDTALALLDGFGLARSAVDLEPFFAVARLLYEGAWVAERYQAIRPFIEAQPESLHPTTLRITKGADRYSAADAFAGLYRLAELRRATETLWTDVDVLMVPTYPKPMTRAALEADPIGPNSALGTYTNFVNLLDLCALAVPGPFRSDGFPSGVTLIAPAGQDARLAALGARLHAAALTPLGATGAPYRDRDFTAAPPGDTIELAVVGAHLSGMPLNRELTSLGGRFVRETRTSPDYRLHALPGGPPARPGLTRVAAGAGHAIAVEVWALPPEGFGRFVASIPAPLGIGTLRLADGTSPKGFLCEAVALDGAEDVSATGGWRAYTQARQVGL